MIKDPETHSERGSVDQPSDGSPRKAYEKPILLDWGSIVELTGGPLADISDDGFSSSGGV